MKKLKEKIVSSPNFITNFSSRVEYTNFKIT